MAMSVEKQYSVFLVNKPGILAQVTHAIAEMKVNIKALTLVDSQEHGVLRVVVEDGERTEKILRSLNIPITKTEVLCVEMDNHPGALADICKRLASDHVNINYAYLSTGSKGGKTVGIFKVSDINKAQKILEVRKPIRKTLPVKRASGKA
jgi:hypothetical protein